MATLVLGAVGTLVGGPLGGAIGALAGRQVDSAIIGSGSRQGPRLRELSVTTSSYGQPIARHFGSVRTPGVIFWATDLKESKETSGGGKGRPKTTTYSYTVSLGVALSSVPISNVGRIWADGNLLRGAAGDLKVGGSMRVYLGTGDQLPDPLIAAEQGNDVPAMRGCAYVVFEDLSLSDFGNRIPAMSFEVIEASTAAVTLSDLSSIATSNGSEDHLRGISGFSDTGGSLSDLLHTIDQIIPLDCVLNRGKLELSLQSEANSATSLPEPLAAQSNNQSRQTNGPRQFREPISATKAVSLRYYDTDRDYQIGIQRSANNSGAFDTTVFEFPASTTATTARDLSQNLARRNNWLNNRTTIQLAEVDSSLKAASVVRLPDRPGLWRIMSWEWMEHGVELELERAIANLLSSTAADSGLAQLPSDLQAQPTSLHIVELPPTNLANATTPSIFAAVAAAPGWTGATLYTEAAETLEPLGININRTSTVGKTVEILNPSQSTHFEPNASILVELLGQNEGFQSATTGALSIGANRLYVGGEIVQFQEAEQYSENVWRLSGLLRGRAGTEHISQGAHQIGTTVILLDNDLLPLDLALFEAGTRLKLAAVGLGDTEPAYAEASSSDVSLAPLAPVHPRIEPMQNGDWNVCWTRRARGAWIWSDNIETPLVEENEQYVLGAGSLQQPLATWISATNDITISSTQLQEIAAQNGPTPLWVKQVGTFDISPATKIATIA